MGREIRSGSIAIVHENSYIGLDSLIPTVLKNLGRRPQREPSIQASGLDIVEQGNFLECILAAFVNDPKYMFHPSG